MTTSDCDVTFFLASDGREWGDYCQSVVGSFPEIAYTVLEVDKHDLDKLPDVTSACSRSPVWVLLATSQLLRCVRETWFSSLLTSPAAASTVVVVTIDDERNVRDVFSSPHVTSRWTVLDCGQREDELRKMMAALLNIIENSQRRQGKADVALQLYPENIREPGTSIAIVFSQEVTSEVKVVVGSSQACPVSRLNSCVLTFTAPVMPPGTYDVSVMVGSHTLHCALTYLPADQRAFDSCHFLRQCVAMTDPRPLDLFLAHAVRLCQQQVRDIFLARRGFYKAPGKLFPTSIHFAAANGLSEFCSALMNITGSREASRESTVSRTTRPASLLTTISRNWRRRLARLVSQRTR
ncbi:uncharacterized protein LOC112561982 isoform X2 [Pomacea canaliculata]|nr:uncharacterized protein LOC112561982 isoform X2 [Pomacea canaliculata]